MRRPRAHASRNRAAHSGAVPGHGAPFRSNLHLSRRAGRTVAIESRESPRGRADPWMVANPPPRLTWAEIEPFRLPTGKTLRKVSPLAGWTTKDVWTYAKAHDIPLLPLYELGYSSIGCEPCTALPVDPANPRSGRGQGQKLECGIHIQPPSTS